MIIGIDLRPLQTGDKYRGIGEVVKQTTSRILDLASRDKAREISFVFYEYDQEDDPKKLIEIPKGTKYEVVYQPAAPADGERGSRRIKNDLSLIAGNPIKGAKKCDVFLQFNYTLGIPSGVKSVLIKHDIIPYVFWEQYFESTMDHVLRRKPRTALRSAYKNTVFMRTLRRALKRSGLIITVSGHTKKDLNEHFGIDESKMHAVPLGVSVNPAKTTHESNKVKMPEKPYLLFLGGIDARRRVVDDIVAAFNSLKADGHDIQLVLAGENFKSPKEIPVEVVRNAVLKSSYKDDIITIGYIDDATKQALFKGALAFVFPTRYEGFGIPVLEAMLMDCPVVAYKNSSIPEVGGKYVYYADNWLEIKTQVEKIAAMSPKEKQKAVATAKAHAEGFTWDKTAKGIYDLLVG